MCFVHTSVSSGTRVPTHYTHQLHRLLYASHPPHRFPRLHSLYQFCRLNAFHPIHRFLFFFTIWSSPVSPAILSVSVTAPNISSCSISYVHSIRHIRYIRCIRILPGYLLVVTYGTSTRYIDCTRYVHLIRLISFLGCIHFMGFIEDHICFNSGIGYIRVGRYISVAVYIRSFDTSPLPVTSGSSVSSTTSVPCATAVSFATFAPAVAAVLLRVVADTCCSRYKYFSGFVGYIHSLILSSTTSVTSAVSAM